MMDCLFENYLKLLGGVTKKAVVMKIQGDLIWECPIKDGHWSVTA